MYGYEYLYIYIYIYIQWRIQDLAQGGDKSGAKRPKNFLSPPWAPQGGDRGGTVPPLKLHSPKILHHLLNEFTRKYQEKNLCPPPESLRGGTFWLSPPWIAQAGDNSQGGDSPPPEIAQGGDSPLVPPPVSALVYDISFWINYTLSYALFSPIRCFGGQFAF